MMTRLRAFRLLGVLGLVPSLSLAAVLTGSYTIKNASGTTGGQYTFPANSHSVYVFHHIGVEVC